MCSKSAVPCVIYIHIEALQIPEKIKNKQGYRHKPCAVGYSINYSEDKPTIYEYKEIEETADYANILCETLEDAKKKSESRAWIPVVLHDSEKYGSHFLRGSGFIDSSKFLLGESIEDLGNILNDTEKISIGKEFQENFELMKTKIHFPHIAIDSFEKLGQRFVPPIRGFSNRLTEEEISADEYERIKKIWTTFKCETISDFLKLYVKSNVLLLQDIFENFRRLSLDKYNLDPLHYDTPANLAWGAMLSFPNVGLERLPDVEMATFLKVRGAITYCFQGCKKSETSSSSIVFLDANNLGGWAMTQSLPKSHFKWLEETKFNTIETKIKNNEIEEDNEIGYILKVDLEYPNEVREQHKGLTFCFPEKSEKIENYIIHYRTLQQCLSHGLELKKIHKILSFKQSKWLEPFISYNTRLRSETDNDFEISLYKFFNNAIYGKAIWDRSLIYIGFCVQELKTTFLYDFHYRKMLPKYKNIEILYVHTDSFIYHIQTPSFYEDLKNDSDFRSLFDTTNIDNKWEIPKINKKVVGKMRDECGGKIIREFVGISPGKYCLDVEGGAIKKLQSCPKYITKKHVSIDDYKRYLESNTGKKYTAGFKRQGVDTVQSTHNIFTPRKDVNE